MSGIESLNKKSFCTMKEGNPAQGIIRVGCWDGGNQSANPGFAADQTLLSQAMVGALNRP
jgi:hypothetical protein